MAGIVIIGAGFAGVATACRLAGRGASPVVVLERDPAPGQRASGRNAGMIRTLLADADLQAVALESAAALLAPPEALAAGPLYARTGGTILAGGAVVPALVAAAERSRAAGRGVEEASGAERSFLTPDDGICDVHALLGAYLAAASAGGVEMRTGVEVREVLVAGGRVRGVAVDGGEIAADVVVNAAGAWAGRIGAGGVGPRAGLEPRRRHLHTTGPLPAVDPDAGWVWHESEGWYYRPESGGYLLSGCDETPMAPCDPPVDPEAEADLAAKLADHPLLGDLPIRKRWACLRTFSADGRPIIGWDPVLEGLYWVAALGGHGVTMSHAVGDLAAREILAGPAAGPPTPFSPSRFP